MSISAPILKDKSDLDEEDEDEIQINLDNISKEQAREPSKVSSNVLRPTHVYEDSPLLQF